jgi:hypothetical protein
VVQRRGVESLLRHKSEHVWVTQWARFINFKVHGTGTCLGL